MQNTHTQSDAELESSSQARLANGSRVATAIVCWTLSGIGLLMSLMMFVSASIGSLLKQPVIEAVSDIKFYMGFGIAYAWLALGVMTGAWVGNRRVHWHWPVLGGMTGLLCSGVFAMFIPLYLPCALLGMYLCCFHLVGATGVEDAA